MNKIMFKLSSAFLAGVLAVGQHTVNTACYGEFYQPKVPAKMMKNK